MSYTYTNGQGVSVLLVTEPNGATEPVSNLDNAVRQIKLFLNDPNAGWPYLLQQLGIAANAGNKNFFSAYSNANQTIPVDTATKVVMGLEQADPDNTYNPSLSRFVAPATGWYKITTSVRVDWFDYTTSTYGNFHLILQKNGSTPVARAEYNFEFFVGTTYVIERSVELSAGDYLELFGFYFVDTGTITCQLTADLTKTCFQGYRIL
jgi:hypothetical protein